MPVRAAPVPYEMRRSVVRRMSLATPGAANDTTAAARVSAASSSAALEPVLVPAVGLTTPTMLPARPPAALSISLPRAARRLHDACATPPTPPLRHSPR